MVYHNEIHHTKSSPTWEGLRLCALGKGSKPWWIRWWNMPSLSKLVVSPSNLDGNVCLTSNLEKHATETGRGLKLMWKVQMFFTFSLKKCGNNTWFLEPLHVQNHLSKRFFLHRCAPHVSSIELNCRNLWVDRREILSGCGRKHLRLGQQDSHEIFTYLHWHLSVERIKKSGKTWQNSCACIPSGTTSSDMFWKLNVITIDQPFTIHVAIFVRKLAAVPTGRLTHSVPCRPNSIVA